jgi:alkylation response protein AidB-like acyl-CoA dehydrogenase
VLCEVFLDGVEIPATNVVGDVDGGWSVLMHTLDFERITAEKVGGAAWLVDGVERSLSDADRLDAAAVVRIGLLRGEVAAARLHSFRAADALDRGVPATQLSAMAKLAGARLVQRAARVAVELLGLDGLAEGPAAPVEGRAAAMLRASVGSTIAGGSAEIQQLVIARRGLGLP